MDPAVIYEETYLCWYYRVLGFSFSGEGRLRINRDYLKNQLGYYYQYLEYMNRWNLAVGQLNLNTDVKNILEYSMDLSHPKKNLPER